MHGRFGTHAQTGGLYSTCGTAQPTIPTTPRCTPHSHTRRNCTLQETYAMTPEEAAAAPANATQLLQVNGASTLPNYDLYSYRCAACVMAC